MLNIWNETLHPAIAVQMTASRCVKLRSVLEQHFQGDLERWRAFYREITQSPFLMGQGQRKWRVTLDWILEPHNLQKTLEGNYRDLMASPVSETSSSAEESTPKAQEYINTLPDPALQQFARILLRFISVETYRRWFAGLQMEQTDEHRMVLRFPCRTHRDHVERRYSAEIGVALRVIYPSIKWIEYEIAPSPPTSSEFPPSCSLQERGKGEFPPETHLFSLKRLDGSSPDEPLQSFSCEDRRLPVLQQPPQPFNLTGKDFL